MSVTVSYDLYTVEPQFTVNTNTTGDQLRPDMLGLSGGGFVAAYNNTDVENGSIRLNFYDADLNVIGSSKIPYLIGIDAIGEPSLTQLANGNVLVVWDDNNSADPGPGLKGAIYTQTGGVVRTEFALTPTSAGYAIPDVTALENGNFVVANTVNSETWLRIYGPTGVQIGGFTKVIDSDREVQVAGLADGGFVLVWEDDTQYLSEEIRNADGSLRATDIHDGDGFTTLYPSIAGLPNGNYVVASWAYASYIGAEVYEILVTIKNPQGEPVGYIALGDMGVGVDRPDVTVLANGFIAVTWTHADNDDDGIYCQILDQSGAIVRIGGSDNYFPLGVSSTADWSSISAILDGMFVAGWEETSGHGSGGSIQGVVRELVRTATGDGAADVYMGDEIKDNFSGNGGNDTAAGGAGDDILRGNSGDDDLEGGEGEDLLQGGSGADLLLGEEGDDIIYANVETPFVASVYRDTLDGGAGEDRLYGAEGAELIQGGLNSDTLYGRAGDDRLYAMTLADADGSSVGDEIYGGDGNDTVVGANGADTLDGGDGDDVLEGGDGADQIVGGVGRDRAAYGSSDAAVAISLTAGTAAGGDAVGDTLSAIEDITGSIFNDTLTGGLANNWLDGSSGDDRLEGMGGTDTLLGGSGADSLFGYSAADSSGFALGDSLEGGSGDDTLTGAGGNDTLLGGTFSDRLVGGEGHDLLYANSAASPEGSSSDDTLEGGAGNDTITGSRGDDLIFGGSGNDVLIGGSGVDTADYSDAVSALVIDMAIVGAQNTLGEGVDSLAGIEHLTASAFADSVKGTSDANWLRGLGAADTLSGRDGADTISGGFGADVLSGGAGADQFRYQSVLESNSSEGQDKIRDFDADDLIDLSLIDAVAGTFGDQAFTFVASFTGQAGEATLNYKATKDTTTMRGDINGDGVADFVLTVNGQLTAADFIA